MEFKKFTSSEKKSHYFDFFIDFPWKQTKTLLNSHHPRILSAKSGKSASRKCKNVYRLQMQDDPKRSLEISPQVTSCYFFTMALTHIYLSKEILVHFFTYLIVHTESIHWTDDTDHLRKPILTAEWL